MLTDATYRCHLCGQRYPLTEPSWRCACGGLFDLDTGRSHFDGMLPATPWSLWRYRAVLPVLGEADASQWLSMGEGMTPLIPCGGTMHLKLDFVMPTGSYKDRGAVMLVTKAIALGARRVVVDSSGNAAISLAAYAARAAIAAEVFVPLDTPMKKVDQLRRYGATVHQVPGGRADAAAAAQVFVEQSQALYGSHVYDPIFYQGTKTVAYEIWEQLGRKAPGTVILPAGNGTLVMGASIGFGELFEAGLIPSVPRILAVQAENCAPLAAGAGDVTHSDSEPAQPTLAEGIAIASPPRAAQLIEEVRASRGRFTTVSETEISEARLALACQGIDVEPTAAAAYAAWVSLGPQSDVPPPVVVILTGTGLKSP